MRKNKIILGLIISIVCTSFIIQSCAPAKALIEQKTGVILWSENCGRCHNIPSPADFTDDQLKTICMHMEIRANLTYNEAQKIVDFMKSAN